MSAFLDTVGVGKGSLNSTEHRPSPKFCSGSSAPVRRFRIRVPFNVSQLAMPFSEPIQYSRQGDATTMLYLPMLAPTVSPPRFFLLWASPSSWVLNVPRNVPRFACGTGLLESLQEVAVLRRESVYCRTRRQRGGATSAAAICHTEVGHEHSSKLAMHQGRFHHHLTRQHTP